MIGVGDLLFTRGTSFAARMIRIGAAFRDEPNLDNHVAVVHHQDAAGIWWVIEGRPGGVGYADARHYLSSKWTNNNIGQSKTDDQRAQIATVAMGMLGTPYDWDGIVADAMDSVGVQDRWAEDWHGQGPPAHVVCSSLACWVYQKVGLGYPTVHQPRLTTPADWDEFVIENGYSRSMTEAAAPQAA